MQWMIYGANGYTGELVVAEALRKGHRPVLAGRNREAIEGIANANGLEARVFPLGDRDATRAALRDVDAVLHCAGPFVTTSAPMLDACLETKTHYLDITGEIAVFEAIMRREAEAKPAGIVAIPGVGFDVVPTDCLAAELAAEMPDADELLLAICTRGGTVSPGTLKTMIEGMPEGGAVRAGGRIVRVPVAYDVREIPFDIGSRTAVTIPWGDVATAYYTTGIPNVRVYFAASQRAIMRMRRLARVAPLLRLGLVRRLAQAAAAWKSGPTAGMRDTGRVDLWGQVSKGGGIVSKTMRTPEGYGFTARSSVAAVERVLAGSVAPGVWTPARAFGAGFARELIG